MSRDSEIAPLFFIREQTMADQRKLLVVDDEEVVCQACRRIFARQGFEVETFTDARQGLVKATENDYAIILLDIKMPYMDGIQFLERLREKKPNVPVLIITGYPSIPNAAAAMRLGACDYVTKPFTSEEVTWGVQRVLNMQHVLNDESETIAAEREAVVNAMANIETLFWDESWVQLAVDGAALVGAALPGLHGATITGIRMARIGEIVYQGLPLAGVSVAGKPMLIIPSPISGVVAEVNSLVVHRPQLLVSDPCGEGWIACVCATRHEEMTNCKPRRLVLVNSNPCTAEEQSRKLTALGCQVDKAANPDALFAKLAENGESVVFLDATSLGDAGADLVERINRQAPHARIVVVGSPGGAREAAYRKHKLFYYAVEPFADDEIAEILVGVYRNREAAPAKTEQPKGPSEPISSISITNRNLHKIQLLAAPGLLWSTEGLGMQIGQKLLAQMFPVVVTPGETQLTPGNILKASETCDRVMVLLARDSGLLPGGLARDTKPEFDVEPTGATVGKVEMLAVQPDKLGGFACLDTRTISALADHIVWDMASY
jgi:FixJ family two-component response regulator/glycine cleavage system H lipoate-binding protein